MEQNDKPKRPRRQRFSAGLPAPSALDRMPPMSLESEQALLGCMILDPMLVLPGLIQRFGTAEVFYELRHQVIYECAVKMFESNIPINVITLSEHLRTANQLEPVGGPTYLNALPDISPSAAGWEYFAEIVEEKWTLRKLIVACTHAISSAYDGEKTVEDIVSNAEKDVLAVRIQGRSKTANVRQLVAEANSDIDRLYGSRGAITGMSTGLIGLDRKTDGLHGSEMIVIAAYPGGGKTALAMNIAERLAIDQRLPVGVFSLEMSAKRLVMRILASRANVNMRSIKMGDAGVEDFEMLKNASIALANAPIHFSDQPDMSISQIRAKARQWVQQFGVRLIVVDYLQLVAGQATRKDQNREQEVSAISRGLKQMAIEFGIPVLALSQLNEDGKLRESRAIGQDADSIWTLRLAEQEKEKQSPVVRVILDLKKQRDGEAPASVELDFFKPYTRFEDVPAVTAEDAQFKMKMGPNDGPAAGNQQI